MIELNATFYEHPPLSGVPSSNSPATNSAAASCWREGGAVCLRYLVAAYAPCPPGDSPHAVDRRPNAAEWALTVAGIPSQ